MVEVGRTGYCVTNTIDYILYLLTGIIITYWSKFQWRRKYYLCKVLYNVYSKNG